MARRIEDLLTQPFADFDWLKELNRSPLEYRLQGSVHNNLHVAITTYWMLHAQHSCFESMRRLCVPLDRQSSFPLPDAATLSNLGCDLTPIGSTGPFGISTTSASEKG